MKQNLADTMTQANKDYPSGSGEWYKFLEGDNEMRILTAFHVYAEHFSMSGYKGVCLGKEEGCQGCEEGTKPTAKWLAWGANKEGLQLYKFGHKIIEQISAYQNDPEYAFDEFPMPYTINVKAKNAGSKEVVYNVIPRKVSEVNAKTIEALEKNHTPEQIVDAMKEKKQKGDEADDPSPEIVYPQEDINPDDIPF